MLTRSPGRERVSYRLRDGVAGARQRADCNASREALHSGHRQGGLVNPLRLYDSCSMAVNVKEFMQSPQNSLVLVNVIANLSPSIGQPLIETTGLAPVSHGVGPEPDVTSLAALAEGP